MRPAAAHTHRRACPPYVLQGAVQVLAETLGLNSLAVSADLMELLGHKSAALVHACSCLLQRLNTRDTC